jgi:8-oxo-dGTP diphosphatase
VTLPAISIVAALIRDETGRVLLVRKRGTVTFMQPGGKRDPGEDDATALARELDEELGCRVVSGSLKPFGEFVASSANEPGFEVHASVYAVDVVGVIAPRAEIEDMMWIDLARTDGIPLAPLTRHYVLPLATGI